MPWSHSSLNRRLFLKASGVSLALPFLESFRGGPAYGVAVRSAAVADRPMRMVCIGNMLGFYPPAFFPAKAGRDYELPPLLKPLRPHRDDLTVFSGLDHGVKGGHFAIHAYLSGVRSVDAKSMPEGNISIDQRAAESVGGATRFPSLTIGSEDGLHGGCQMCWTRSGTRVPPIPGPKELFHKLFINDNPSDRKRAEDRLRLKRSILDAALGDARSLERRLGQRDRAKLDEFFASIRHVEQQLEFGRQWANVPKPQPGMEEPENTNLASDLPVLYRLLTLALQTDSTRVATLEIAGGFNASAFGYRKDYHALSHHGQVQESIDALIRIETYQMEQFAAFLERIKSMGDGEGSLLDHTMVLLGSGMGNANSHVNSNLPIVLAGGGFRHGEHRAFPPNGRGRIPLCNLFLSMLHRFGVESSAFGVSTGTLAGLEVA